MRTRSGRLAVPAALFVLLCAATPAPADDHPGESWVTEQGLYRVSYESRLEPVPINRMHGWVLHVETADGEPVEGAEIKVGGGMPAHAHGLPTRPRVVADLGDGDYRLEGLRFHMRGHWEISLSIAVNGTTDSVVIPLYL